MSNLPICWCGQHPLENFSQDYLRCPKCETLVLKNFPEHDLSHIKDEQTDLYGANYAERHLESEYGYPEFSRRARQDLPERCTYWLKSILSYKLPPAKVLELGSFHGGFIALMKLAGYQAQGLELSPQLAQDAANRFGIDMLSGPIEQQSIPPATLDVIALFDVLEHLQNPEATLEQCRTLLKPDGILVIQTPRYVEGRTYADLTESNDPFLIQFKPAEHLYLFSNASLSQLLERAGFLHHEFEPPIFSAYDQFVFASNQPLKQHSTQVSEQALLGSPHGRMALAMLDATSERDQHRTHVLHTEQRLAQIDIALKLRDQQVSQLTVLAKEHEAESDKRANQIDELTRLLKIAQADADARAEQLKSYDEWLKSAQLDNQALRQAHHEAEKTALAVLKELERIKAASSASG